ncbi:hypothetical protein ABIE26_002992 [Pedobacter africanus]
MIKSRKFSVKDIVSIALNRNFSDNVDDAINLCSFMLQQELINV